MGKRNRSRQLQMLTEECEFVQSIEDILPLTHDPENWKEDIRIARETIDEPGSASALEAILDFRTELFEAATVASYQWLLDAVQVAQRTKEWYEETKDILTASEFSNVWKGPRTRAALVLSKAPKDDTPRHSSRLACYKQETSPMDWGVRYEPVVKQLLKYTIQDLGRIRHRKDSRLAASPDGLFVGKGEYEGYLVEIKCPTTRPIKEDIPFEYWCQMQLQMEVCDRQKCLYVEMKFKEVPFEEGMEHWISLDRNDETFELRYRYSPNTTLEEGWTSVEQYGWEVLETRKTLVNRDSVWFASIQGDLELFWKDVQEARAGTWNPDLPPPRKSNKKEKCHIVDFPSAEN